MKKKKIPKIGKDCFLCFYFTREEFTEEDIRRCAEHWMDAKNCPNWNPANVFIGRKKIKDIIWVDVNV